MFEFTNMYHKLIETLQDFSEISETHWFEKELFTLQWWVFAAVMVLVWWIWWRLVDRGRMLEILFVGLLSSIIAIILDIMGSEAVWWSYPVRVFPKIPRLIPIDIGVIPVTYMLLYQYYSSWKKYLFASIIMGLTYTFIAEPLLVWMKLYKLYGWEYVYSFPLYIAIAVICKYLVALVLRYDKRINSQR